MFFKPVTKTRLNNNDNLPWCLDWKGIANGRAIYFIRVLSGAVTACPNRPIIPRFQLYLIC